MGKKKHAGEKDGYWERRCVCVIGLVSVPIRNCSHYQPPQMCCVPLVNRFQNLLFPYSCPRLTLWDADTGDGEGGEDCESKQIENWADSIVGASALNRRRLVRVFDAGDTRLLLYAGAKTLLVADCTSGSLIECEQPHTERVSAIACHAGRFIVTGGQVCLPRIVGMSLEDGTTLQKYLDQLV